MNATEFHENNINNMVLQKKICTLILETENCAKSYFRNCPNYPKYLNPEIIGGHYFTETHKNKYIKISRNFV